MKNNILKTYFTRGLLFLRDHQQLWLTALVGVTIIVSFLFVAWRFTTIAQQAQEELVQTRISAILDAFVVLAPEVVNNQDTLRGYMQKIKADNPTIDTFSIYAEHGSDAWRLYVNTDGLREGTVVSDLSIVLNFALLDPSEAFTFESETSEGRRYTTARAITNANGLPIAVAVTEQGLAQIDKQLTDSIRTSMYTLLILLFVITVIFFRHAHIVDFAVLYRKQLEIDEMKDSFISMASHELKTPLSIIRGYVEFLKNEQDEGERQKYLSRIDISAEELRHLVDDILDVSRIESGRLQFVPEEMHPYSVLEDVYEMFKQQTEKKGLRFTISADEKARNAVIQTDTERLKQALVNIVSNALKYTFHGEISLKQKLDEKYIELVIEDTGVGMTVQQQKRLFDKFYRAQEEETKDVSGTGLGLWIAKQLIEHMNGTISVESIKGTGSTFTVRVPRK